MECIVLKFVLLIENFKASCTEPHWYNVSIGSDNDLKPSGNKPLLEAMSTQIYAAISPR